LPYHYSDLHTLPRLLDRLATMEDALIGRADRIITPSPVTREHLLDRGADPGRITLVPNSPSVVPTARSLQPRDARIRLCYIGTLTSWQGLYDAIKVMARLAHHPIHLTVATAARRSDRKALARFARKRGLSEQIAIVDPVPPSQLLTFLQQHDLGLAPLTPCARNLVQGCMPIKVLDYMAAGLPVLAPDMPAVQHIVGDNYPLYRRYSRGHMTDHLERLVTDPGLRETLSRQGLQRARHFGPQRQRDALLGVYRDLASTSSST
ncbi:MAG: glycosyltransferase, partial [Myxococcota bacterium]